MEYKTKISEEEIEELPNFTFDGEIIVIDHEDKVDAAVDDLSSYPYRVRHGNQTGIQERGNTSGRPVTTGHRQTGILIPIEQMRPVRIVTGSFGQ